MTLSRPVKVLLAGLLLMMLMGAVAYSLAVSGGHHASLVMGDMDLSDSVLGWMIAIPIMFAVGALLAVIFAGVGVIVAGAMTFAMIVVAIAMLIAFLPVLAFLAIPLLAVYGLVKLFSRSPKATAAT